MDDPEHVDSHPTHTTHPADSRRVVDVRRRVRAEVIRCRLGVHRWERVDYYHAPDWHDLREYGGHYFRCAQCRSRPQGRRVRRWRWSGVTIKTGGAW